MSKSPREVLLAVASIVLSLTIVVLLSEMSLRLWAERQRTRIRESLDQVEMCTVASDDGRLVYTYAPGMCGASSTGYFDDEHAPQKPPGAFRIVIIGDSVAQGRGVEHAATFGEIIEHRLGDALMQPVEVIVLARIGYSTSQQLVLLEEEAVDLQPDLILWSYCLNDPAHPVFDNANGELGRYYYRPRSYLVYNLQRFVHGVRVRLALKRCPSEYHEFLHCMYGKDVERNLMKIGDVAAAAAVPTVLLIHPIFQREGFDAYSLHSVHEQLAASANAAGLQPLDLFVALSPYAPDEVKMQHPGYYDPWHLNENGHRVTGEYIADELERRGLVGTR